MEKSLCALVVEDNTPMRSMLRKMLAQMRYFINIEEAADGEEAWEKLNRQTFDLVICDINMPRLDGIGLLKRCRAVASLKDLPFLMISGESVQEMVAFVGEWGANDYIIKPFSYTVLKQRVETIFEKLRDPEETLYRQVERLKDSGHPEDALDKIEQFEKVMPTPKVKWMNLKGECLMALNRVEEAAEHFEQALLLSEVYLPAHKNYAVAQQKMGNSEKAIEALEKADSLSPMDLDRKLTLGKLLLQSDRQDEGKALLEKALKLSPPDERESNRLKVAEAFLEHNCFAEAEKLFIRALKDDPKKIETYNRLGIALRRQGKYAEAEKHYNRALFYHPDNPAILYNLGVLHMNKQEKQSAVELFKKVLKIDPGFSKAREMLKRMAQDR